MLRVFKSFENNYWGVVIYKLVDCELDIMKINIWLNYCLIENVFFLINLVLYGLFVVSFIFGFLR